MTAEGEHTGEPPRRAHGSEAKNRATAGGAGGGTAAAERSAIEIAGRIEDEIAAGFAAVAAAGKVVDDFFRPVTACGRRQLNHGAEAQPSDGGGGVEIPLGVENRGAFRGLTVCPAAEVVQDGLRPASAGSGRDFEDGAGAIARARNAGAVEMPFGIENQVTAGFADPGAAEERIKYVLGPPAAGGWRKFIGIAAVIAAAEFGCAEEIAGSVKNQSGHRKNGVAGRTEVVENGFGVLRVGVRS